MSLKPPISQAVVTRLMPVFLKSLNTIYSSSAKLTDMDNYDRTSEEEDGIIFYKKENETDTMFKFVHKHYPTPNNHKISFQNFDMDLDLYINNFLSLCGVYANNPYFFVDTRLFLDDIFNSGLLSKLFIPKVASNNIHIQLEIYFHKDLTGVFYLSCQSSYGKMIVTNKKDVHHFFEQSITHLKELFNIPDEINLDYTQTEEEFKKGTILLHMATI